MFVDFEVHYYGVLSSGRRDDKLIQPIQGPAMYAYFLRKTKNFELRNF